MRTEDVRKGSKYVLAVDTQWADKGTIIRVLDSSTGCFGSTLFFCEIVGTGDNWSFLAKQFEEYVNHPKLNILGFKRSGKDTAAEYFRDTFGMTFQSSSMAAAEIFIFDALMKKYDYASKEDCYDDRMNRRDEWFNLICDYNKNDKTKLAKEILSKTGAYVGMRSKEEVQACIDQDVFDIIIWIDAEDRVGKEGSDSCTVTKEDAHIIITNNGTEAEFKEKLNKVGKIIFKKLD